MDIGEFDLGRITFELRFDQAFALWDRAGALTGSLTAQFPAAKLNEANPGRISLVIKPNTELVVELEKAFVICHSPKRTAEELVPFAVSLTKFVTEYLEVKSFSRIGTRVLYKKGYEKITSATERLLSIGQLKIPEGRFLGVEGKPETVGYTARWEGKATGVRVALTSQTQKIEFTPAPSHAKEVEEIDKERHELLLDIDYFSADTVMPDQFRADEWIKNVMHLINRDIHFFLKPL